MDITVRVEVQYVAPEHALVRDVLRMFRSPAWVRFMVRYISPHLKNAAPAHKAVLDSLSRWTEPSNSNSSNSNSKPQNKKRAAPDSDSDNACECDAASCVICMSALVGEAAEEAKQAPEEAKAVVRLPCGHGFHAPCIRSWLSLRSTCPSCRFQLRKAFSGSYAVRTLNSALLLRPEHRALAKDEVLRMPVGRETVRAVVNVTLSQLPPHAPQSQYPCVLNALLMHANGDSFTEAAALGKNGVDDEVPAPTHVGRADDRQDGEDNAPAPRNKRLRVA